jgi:nicotinate-nucleotide adenylyltransferase
MTPDLFKNRAIGLLGGSFNPAHDGHRHISLYALKMLGLHEVWWMVSPQNPLKSTTDMAPLKDRMQSARKASRHPKIRVTDIEQSLNTRYTSDTLDKLHALFPNTTFVWLMGTDNLRQIHRWQEWQKIFATTPVCVLDRPPRGNSIKSCPAALRFAAQRVPETAAASLKTKKTPCWTILHIPLNPLSATAIRLQQKAKKPILHR